MIEWSRGKERVLLAGWLLAAWSPLTYGLAAYVGQSTMMMADLLRRTIELVALFLAWYIYHKARKQAVSPAVYQAWETTANLAIAVVMLVSVAIILLQAYRRLLMPGELGALHWGILLGFLGVIVNGWFWGRHARYAAESYSAMSESQYRLFRSKTLLDGYVVLSLSTATFVRQWPWGVYVDPLGSLVPALVVVISAVQILRLHLGATRASG